MTTKPVTVDAGRDSANERADLEMGRITIEDDFAMRGYQYEKTMRKRAKNFLFLEKLAKDTGLSREDLFRFSPQGGGNTNSSGLQPQIGADGKPVIGPDGKPVFEKPQVAEGLEFDEIKDRVGESEPETAPPEIPSGVSPVIKTEMPVDAIPKQNGGLSRPVDQSFYG